VDSSVYLGKSFREVSQRAAAEVAVWTGHYPQPRPSCWHPLLVGIVGVLFPLCATAQVRYDQWWSSTGSAGTVQAGDETKVVYDGPTVSVKPGASATLRYNVVAVSSISGNPVPCTERRLQLRIRYRDEFTAGPVSPPTKAVPHPLPGVDRVVATLFQVRLADGSITQLVQFDSDRHDARRGFQLVSQDVPGPLQAILDFSLNAYWVEVKLVDSVVDVDPIPAPAAVAALQIDMFCYGL